MNASPSARQGRYPNKGEDVCSSQLLVFISSFFFPFPQQSSLSSPQHAAWAWARDSNIAQYEMESVDLQCFQYLLYLLYFTAERHLLKHV